MPNGYRAVWRGCVTNRDGLFNDVAATGDGGFIATVMISKAAWDRPDLLDVMVSGVDTIFSRVASSGADTVPNSEPNCEQCAMSRDKDLSTTRLGQASRFESTTVKPDMWSRQPMFAFILTNKRSRRRHAHRHRYGRTSKLEGLCIARLSFCETGSQW